MKNSEISLIQIKGVEGDRIVDYKRKGQKRLRRNISRGFRLCNILIIMQY